MKMKTLEDLFHYELRDLASAEKQLTKALPKMAKAASSEDLRQAFESHLEETEQHLARVEEICEKLNVTTRGAKCRAMEGLIEEGQEFLEEEMEDHVRDAGLICAAQRVEHYEIAGYGCARTFAQQLGHEAVAQTLQGILDQEKSADEKLTELAMQHINQEAVA